jgi:lipoprotein signal peptidase
MRTEDRRTATVILVIAVCVIGIDQATKTLADQVHGLAAVLPVRNDQFTLGVASASLPIMATLMALGIILFGGYTGWEAFRGRQPRWVPAFVIGGALSNLADRLLLGSVRDFLAVPHLVVLNLADVAVFLGLIGFMALRVARAKLWSRGR